MKTERAKITIFYRDSLIGGGVPGAEDMRATTTFIIDIRYLFEFMSSLIREDISRVEVCEI